MFMRLYSRVVAASLTFASFIIVPETGATSRPFGAPFPGSKVGTSGPVNGCGERYKFSTNASLASVAKYYLEEGSEVGLTLLKDTDAGDPAYRMIAFTKPHGHQLLFVTLNRTGNVTDGNVYYAPANRARCT